MSVGKLVRCQISVSSHVTSAYNFAVRVSSQPYLRLPTKVPLDSARWFGDARYETRHMSKEALAP